MTDEQRELRPAGRHEWEQILGRLRVTGVLGNSGRVGKNGRATRGGMSALTFKAIAARFAFYGDGDGTRIWPGDAVVAVDLETTIDRVSTVRKVLLGWGLFQHVRGRRGERGEEYQLTLPSDLLESVEVLTPAQHKLAAHALRDARRGKGHRALGGPAEALTNHRPTTPPTNHAEDDLRTAVTVSRASPAVNDQEFELVGKAPPDIRARSERCEHGVPPSLRCPACVRGLSVVVRLPRDLNDHPPEQERLAPVLAFRSRTA